MDLLLASVGPLTGAAEAVASSIGSGVVIGGFFGGTEVGPSPRSYGRLQRRAALGSYAGGFLSLLLLLADIVGKHFV